MNLSVEKSKSLGEYGSKDLDNSFPKTPKKLTLVTKTNSKKKQSSPVSFKN